MQGRGLRGVLGPVLIPLLLLAGCGGGDKAAAPTGGANGGTPAPTTTRPAGESTQDTGDLGAAPASESTTPVSETTTPVSATTTTEPDRAAGGGGGREVPDVRFRYFDGSEGSPADFAGTPTVINFWASWCAPCVVELPAFEAVHRELHPQVAFLGLNVGDEPGAARALVERTGVTYLLATDPDSTIFQTFGGIGMPTTVLVDADGIIVTMIASRLRAQDLRSLIAEHLGV